jgi:hypothetical protein
MINKQQTIGQFYIQGEKGDNDMNIILQFLSDIKSVEEKFAEIQENTALYVAENGLTDHEITILEKLIEQLGEVGIAADAITKRLLGNT